MNVFPLLFIIIISIFSFVFSLTQEEFTILTNYYNEENTQFYTYINSKIQEEIEKEFSKIVASKNVNITNLSLLKVSPTFESFLNIVDNELKLINQEENNEKKLFNIKNKIEKEKKYHYNFLFLKTLLDKLHNTINISSTSSSSSSSSTTSSSILLSNIINNNKNFIFDFYLLYYNVFNNNNLLNLIEKNFIIEFSNLYFNYNLVENSIELNENYLLIEQDLNLLFNLSAYYTRLNPIKYSKLIFDYFESENYDDIINKINEYKNSFITISYENYNIFDSNKYINNKLLLILEKFINKTYKNNNKEEVNEILMKISKMKDSSYYNNLSLIYKSTNKYEESYKALMKGYELDKNSINVKINLFLHYNQFSDLIRRNEILDELIELSPNDSLYYFFKLFCFKEYFLSNKEINQCKKYQYENGEILLKKLLDTDNNKLIQHEIVPYYYNPANFYLTYNGLNNIKNQILIKNLTKNIFQLSNFRNNNLFNSDLYKQNLQLIPTNLSTNKIKIGFISSIFKAFDPHSLLLAGLIRNLPREHFEVSCYFTAFLNKDIVKDYFILEACDESIVLPSDFNLSINEIMNKNLDILVFGEFLCEQVNHILAFTRVATYQVCIYIFFIIYFYLIYIYIFFFL